MRFTGLAIIGAAAAMLSGCLVSEAPMFDPASASAAPLQSGRYEACSEPLEPEGDECQLLDVRRRDDGAYEFQVAEEDQIIARFHEIDAATYAAQFADDDGDGYQYYWARRDGDAILLVMIWCEDFPPEMREAMKSDGLIVQEGDSSTCTALKREAVVAAVKAYRDGVVVSDDGVRLSPAP